MALITNTAVAYINFGRWVADCPTGCGAAWKLEPGEMLVQCGECLNVCPVQWPPNADELWEALAVRPLNRTRNWFPAGHEFGTASNCPTGQSVEDLNAETREYMGEQISPFWSENNKQRDCQDCVEDVPHTLHWASLRKQDGGT